MAAKTIKSFLVGLGLDVDEKSFKEAENGFDFIGKKALQLGAVVTGAFGAKALTFDFAADIDQLGKFSEFLKLSADDISAYGGAIEQSGGSLDSFKSQLLSITQLRAGELVGDFGYISEALKAGVSNEALSNFRNARSAIESYLALADVFNSTQTAEQQQNIAAAFGLDPASVRLLTKSREEVEALVKSQRAMRPVTKEMTALAADFNDNIQMLSRSLQGLADVFSVEFMKELNSTLDNINSFFGENQGEIKSAAGYAVRKGVDGTKSAAELLTFLPYIYASEKPAGETINDSLGIIVKPVQDYVRDIFEHLNLPKGGLVGLFSGDQEAQQGNSYRGQIIRQAAPITINNEIKLDGQVIDKRVNRIMGEEAEKAISDLSSSTD
tara:strand:- start:1677 stop:2825 length:1149 start_codon:yes stop_codon:yes gene_type:complete